MGRLRSRSNLTRADRRGMIALCAVFALLVQILAPGLASAGPALPDGSMLICADGGQNGLAGAPIPPGGNDHPCDHCVCPPSMAPPPTPLQAGRVAYVVAAAAPRPRIRYRIPPARAPPRPPGQGPPASYA